MLWNVFQYQTKAHKKEMNLFEATEEGDSKKFKKEQFDSILHVPINDFKRK